MQLKDSGRGYSPVCPEGSTILCTLVAVAQVGESSSVLNLLCVKDQPNENWAQVWHLADFLASYERGFLTHFSHCFFLLSFSSSLHLCCCLQSIGQVIVFSFLKVVFETVYLTLGFKPTWQGLCCMPCHSVVFNWDLALPKPMVPGFRT